jgi:hypothetical protein
MRWLTRSGPETFPKQPSPGARYLEVEVFSESALVELRSSGNFRQESLRRNKLRQAEIPLTTRSRDASVARCASDGAATSVRRPCLSAVGKIPQPIIEKREKLREVAGRHGVDLRTAALQFSATPDIASALIVGAASEQQIVADYSSMQVKIPAEFWAVLKERKLIEQDAPVPA